MYPSGGDETRRSAAGAAPAERTAREWAGLSPHIGLALAQARDAAARWLVRSGVHPNHLTVAGAALSVGAGICLFLGASHQLPLERPAPGVTASYWPLWAALLLALAGALDILDGATARQGRLRTPFGGILDSTLDRWSDMALYGGIALHFATRANVTFVLLALLAMAHAVMISYVKARAESEVSTCEVGYWARGERIAMLWLGCLSGHVPAAVWMLAFLPAFTVAARLRHAWCALAAHGSARRTRGRFRLPVRRGTALYDMITMANALWVLAMPTVCPALRQTPDPLRAWLAVWL